MRVGLVTGHERIELRELPEPEPSPGKAVVEIHYCGICGTDLHAYHTGAPYNPAICGHEWTGTVSAVGPDAGTLREGDRVGVGVASPCGACAECRSGDGAHCSQVTLGMVGLGPMAAAHGGFARAIAMEAARLYPVHPQLSDVDAALLEPATVAVHALRRTPLRLGESCVVIGAGPIGLLVLQCARIAGAGCCVVVEPEPTRARMAAELGASDVIDPRSQSVDERVKASCGPLGADVVFECAGLPETIDQSVSLVRRGGVVSLVGLATVPAQISPASWLSREVRVVASIGYLHEEFEVAMQLAADGRLRLAPLHSGTVSLDELEGAFHRLLAGGGDVKLLVDPRIA
ncbi:MAG: zinc-binding dehydrogenase [Myxococcota bacterium]|nr:zinc-binding dehydrogenase [Myxococcota bacterium]